MGLNTRRYGVAALLLATIVMSESFVNNKVAIAQSASTPSASTPSATIRYRSTQPGTVRNPSTQHPSIRHSTIRRGTAQSSPLSNQPLSQYERIYLSTSGDFLGAHTIFGGTVLFIDRTGNLDLVTRDYTAELDYDYTGRLNRIGATTIAYDYQGRVDQIGTRVIDYDFRSRLGQLGVDDIAYTPRGKVSQIGNVTIQYSRGYIDTISANYTSSGARIVVVTHN